ncbi:uncharacterized protein Dwil_GK27787 [Drosophila willistoni]|uniref:Uncharacterized protein n=1 Tax=Drosophila willistoni TaxID=7260 RepID=A0A0Q9X1X8_DROWI|nr:uncharacterized protein Dwil_GK27787 [Drosophila willistoni]
MSNHCLPFVERVNRLNRICTGIYDMEISLKFRSALVTVNEPITVFMNTKKTMLFAALKLSTLHLCDNLDMINTTHFVCLNSKGESRPLSFIYSQVWCFPHHIYMGDLLLKSCLRQNEISNSGLIAQARNTKIGALQYTIMKHATSNGIHKCLHKWMIIIITQTLMMMMMMN